LATLLEPCVEMWQFLLSFFGSNFWLLKISKSTWLFFSAFNFEYTFFWLLCIASLKRAILTLIFLIFFWGRFCDVAKSGDDHQHEDLARIGDKKNMKEFFCKTLFYIFGYLIEIWRFFKKLVELWLLKYLKKTWVYHFEDIEFWLFFFNKKNSGQNMAIENMRKALDDF
jgi:hypothetical protein